MGGALAILQLTRSCKMRMLLFLLMPFGAFAPPRFNAGAFSQDTHTHVNVTTVQPPTQAKKAEDNVTMVKQDVVRQGRQLNVTVGPPANVNGTGGVVRVAQETLSINIGLKNGTGDAHRRNNNATEGNKPKGTRDPKLNKELFERKQLERVHKQGNGSAARPTGRIANGQSGSQMDCLQLAACLYGANLRNDDNQHALTHKDILEQLARFLVEYADEAVEGNGQPAKDALYTGYHSGLADICERMYTCPFRFKF